MAGNYYVMTPSQEVLIYQEKFSLHKGMAQLPIFLEVNKKLDFDLMKKAINIEIARNDTMRLRFHKNGKTYHQQFIAPYEDNTEIKINDFTGKTQAEQDAYLKKLALTPMRYEKNHIYRFEFFRTCNNKSGIYITVSHMAFDATGVFILLTDLIDVYNALETGSDMPKPLATFEECMIRDNKYYDNPQKRQDNINFFFDRFDELGKPDKFSGIVNGKLPAPKRNPKNEANTNINSLMSLFRDKSGSLIHHMDGETAQRLISFCDENKVTFTTLFIYGLSAYFSKINSSNDIIFLYICSRRATLADRRSSGCRMMASYFRDIPDDNADSLTVMKSYGEVQANLFRHADTPVTDLMPAISGRYNISNFNYNGGMMFSCIPLPYTPPEGWECEVRMLSSGRNALPMYLFIIPSFKDRGFDIYIEYQYHFTNEEQEKALLAGTFEAIEATLKNPNATFAEIKNSITNA